MQNLPQQFQAPFSQNQKTFSWFFIAFLKCAWNLEPFQEKDEYPSLKYSGSNMQNLPQQFQTPLSQKENTFSRFFIPFLKCAWNLEPFQEKDEYPSLIISELIDAKRRGYLNV